MKKSHPKGLAVAVPNLLPPYYLWNTKTGALDRVIGGYVADNALDNSVYIEGENDKKYRQAAEECRYENEVLFFPVPNKMQEVILSENPECKLLLMDCTVLEMPEVQEPKRGTLIKLPAAAEYEQRHKEEKLRKAHNKLLKLNKGRGTLTIPFPPSEDFSQTFNQRTA